MRKNRRNITGRFFAHSESVWNLRRITAFLAVACFSITRASVTAQTAETSQVIVSGEPVPTATPYDNWREMRQHIMPEVSGTEITVTKRRPSSNLSSNRRSISRRAIHRERHSRSGWKNTGVRAQFPLGRRHQLSERAVLQRHERHLCI
jgi:hypothetical protein